MGNLGSLFGLLKSQERYPDGPYGSPADGYWAKTKLTIYIPPDIPKDRADKIIRGIQKWNVVLKDERLVAAGGKIDLAFTRESAMQNDISFAFSNEKPHGKWGWKDSIGRVEGEPWNYAHVLITLWTGIPSGDWEKTATHEFGHALGLTRHSEGGLMDENIKSGDIHQHDKTTFFGAYLRTDRPRQDRMRN